MAGLLPGGAAGGRRPARITLVGAPSRRPRCGGRAAGGTAARRRRAGGTGRRPSWRDSSGQGRRIGGGGRGSGRAELPATGAGDGAEEVNVQATAQVAVQRRAAPRPFVPCGRGNTY